MSRSSDDETRARAEEIVRQEGQPHGRGSDGPNRGTAAMSKKDRDVVRANEAAKDEVGGAEPEPGLGAGNEALGTRLGSTDAADRAIEPLSDSDSDDTSESASSNRYGRR